MMLVRSLGFLGLAILSIVTITFLLHSNHLSKSALNKELSFKTTFINTDKRELLPPAVIVPAVAKLATLDDSRNKLLFMTASYTFDQFHCLQKVLDCMRDICNAGWEVSVLIDSASGLNYSHPRYAEIQDRAYCIRTGKHIPIIVEEYGQIGFGLNAKHRQYMTDHLNEFDYFSYAEEDMLLTVSHLTAFVDEQEKLKAHLGSDWIRYFIGFIRYEDSVADTERTTWEYMAHQIHVVNMGKTLGNYVVTNNLNQAIYILSREHIIDLEKRCDFLSKPGKNYFYGQLRKAQNAEWKYMSVGVSEWSSSFQQVLQCGMRRIIPTEHFQLFMIHHSSNIAQKRRLRKEQLTYSKWMDVIANQSLSPISIDKAYNEIIYQQYNLYLIDKEKYDHSKAKWSWGEDFTSIVE